MPYRGAIFDLDGVLVDTVPLHFEAWKTMFHHHGVAFDEAAYRAKVDGRTRSDGVRAMMPDADEATVQRAADEKQALFTALLAKQPLKVFDASISLVHRLADGGVPLAVASSSINLAPILQRAGVDHRFQVIVSGADVLHGKPDPEIFLRAARRLGLAPADCVVFEDAAAGVEAAKRGGFFCVAIDRLGRPENLQAADMIISDLQHLDADQLFGIRS
ncbi:MAG: beta-phosphoglucomutase family hydrolase [Alphaproteobacteria bacterium]